MTRGFLIPQAFAAASALVTLAAAVAPLAGYPWQASAGLVCVAAVGAFVAHKLAAMKRDGRRLARKVRRVYPLSNVSVLTLPTLLGGSLVKVGCETCDGTGCPCVRSRDWWSMDYCDCGCPDCGLVPPKRDDWSRKVHPEDDLHARMQADPGRPAVFFNDDPRELRLVETGEGAA